MLQLDFVLGIIRQLFFFLDQIIYGFIPILYDFIMLLAKQKLFTEEAIQALAGNIYAIIGVFVLFRLAFVLLNAIMDPDKLNDQQKGFPKMLGRVVVALILIVAIPWVFSYAYKLQAVIINQGLIGKIILGSDHKYDQDPGQQMGEMAFKAFFMCNPNSTGTGNACQNELDEQGFKKAFPPKTPDSETKTASNFDWLLKHLNDETGAVNSNEGEIYKYSYTFGISTIAGGFILAMLVIFIFDIAVRVVKLGFLQLIAPVAVIGYIEPDGGIFNRWLKMCTSTYINLFVRILAITFVVYVLGILNTSLIFESMDSVEAAFIKIFIIFGALMFAKEAPVMLKNMFNLEEGSIGTLNPMKKLGAVPVVGGLAAAGITAGANAGLAIGANKLAGVGGALGGGIGAKLRGGSFRAGAKEGRAAAAAKIPVPKLTDSKIFDNKFAAAIGSGLVGGTTAFSGVAGQEAVIKKAIDKAGGDESAMFKDQGVRADYQAMAAKKEAVKQQKEAMARHRNNYSDSQLKYKTSSDTMANANNKYTQASQGLAAAKATRDSAQARAAKLKQDMDSLRPSDPNIISPTYSAAKREYDTYMAAGGEYEAANTGYSSAVSVFQGAERELGDAQTAYTDARGNLEGVQRDLQTTTVSLETAEKAFSTAETKFNTNLEGPGNSKDAETYKAYKRGKSAGRL